MKVCGHLSLLLIVIAHRPRRRVASGGSRFRCGAVAVVVKRGIACLWILVPVSRFVSWVSFVRFVETRSNGKCSGAAWSAFRREIPMPDMPANPKLSSGLSASSSLRALVDSWRDRSTRRGCVSPWTYQHCANELSAALDAHQAEEKANECLPGTPGPKSCDEGAPVAARRCDHGLPLAPRETGCECLGHARKSATIEKAEGE
jgi:hypothetical protein